MTSDLALLRDTLSNKDTKKSDESQLVRPQFFRLNDQSDVAALTSLLNKKPFIRIFDTIESQLLELVRSAHPSRVFSLDELGDAVKHHLAGKEFFEYGVWV